MASTLPVFNDYQNFTGTLQYVDGSAVTVIGGDEGWFKKDDADALRAVATSSTNKGAIVDDLGGYGAGFFRWDNSSTLDDDGFNVIAPSDAGTGRWIKLV